jgi:hypothetical protein
LVAQQRICFLTATESVTRAAYRTSCSSLNHTLRSWHMRCGDFPDTWSIGSCRVTVRLQYIDILVLDLWMLFQKFHEQTRLSGQGEFKIDQCTAAGTLTWTYDRFQIAEGVDLRCVWWYGVVQAYEGEND